MGFLRHRSTYAYLVASIAVFAALGGSAYAAIDGAQERDAAETSAGTTEPSASPLLGTPSEPKPPLPSRQPSSSAPGPTGGMKVVDPEASDVPDAADADGVRSRVAEDPNVISDSGGKGGRPRPVKRSHDKGDKGPPPWAPAHGYRCRKAGNSPGSNDFRNCVQNGKAGGRRKK